MDYIDIIVSCIFSGFETLRELVQFFLLVKSSSESFLIRVDVVHCELIKVVCDVYACNAKVVTEASMPQTAAKSLIC